MWIIESILDITGYLLLRLKELIVLISKILFDLAGRLYEKFLEISIPEKIIFLNTIPAFMAVVLPVAKFSIFESYFNVNNPLSVYMIGIVIIMFISIYFSGFAVFITRISLNCYYLFWIIYIPLAGDLTRANPHVIAFGYYLNIIVPIVYILASLASYKGRA